VQAQNPHRINLCAIVSNLVYTSWFPDKTGHCLDQQNRKRT